MLVQNYTKRNYSDLVEDHFRRPRNVGSFPDTENNVGTAVVGKAACGDLIKLQIKVENDKIKDVKYKVFGCGGAIASSSYASELVKGMTLDDALKLKNTQISESLSLPPIKLHCSLLAEDAIKTAIQDYRRKLNQADTAKVN